MMPSRCGAPADVRLGVRKQITDKSIVLDAQTLPRVQMPNRDGFIPDPRPEIFK
jgi:hypothetical protein